jgi:hypothetical protein
MKNLILVPTMAQSRLNLGEFAEDATVVTDSEAIQRPKRVNHFIEANTEEVTLQHLREDCITPVFAKDNELTVSHPDFISTIQSAVCDFFRGEQVEPAEIRVSHVVKGRIPEAIHKPVNQLLESDKTIYYERCAFSIDIPTIYETVEGNRLNLSIVGVRAYNLMNLYSRKTPELFKLAIGFSNTVCCNLCVFSTGYNEELRVGSTYDLYHAALDLFSRFNPAMQIHLLQALGSTTMSEHQFCEILGKMRLYQYLDKSHQRSVPKMMITDSQINTVARCYLHDDNFAEQDGELDMWRFYNLLTGANKSSYIDSFLDRSLNATEVAVGINGALRGEDSRYSWFIE